MFPLPLSSIPNSVISQIRGADMQSGCSAPHAKKKGSILSPLTQMIVREISTISIRHSLLAHDGFLHAPRAPLSADYSTVLFRPQPIFEFCPIVNVSGEHPRLK